MSKRIISAPSPIDRWNQDLIFSKEKTIVIIYGRWKAVVIFNDTPYLNFSLYFYFNSVIVI